MLVFLSWSKPRSKAIATALHGWLPRVLQEVEPWMSQKDIDAGRRWALDIADALEKADFGIVCVTPDSLEQPWLHFEAGALAKKVSTSKVIPYLVGVEMSHLQKGPLGSFQAKRSTKEETFEMVASINKALTKQLTESQLEETFEVWWPKLQATLSDDALNAAVEAPEEPGTEVRLDDLFLLVHNLLQNSDTQGAALERIADEVKALRTAGGGLPEGATLMKWLQARSPGSVATIIVGNEPEKDERNETDKK